MKTFAVLVTREVTESATLVFHAETEEEAKELALECAKNTASFHFVQFERDDNSEADPYVTGCEEADEDQQRCA